MELLIFILFFVVITLLIVNHLSGIGPIQEQWLRSLEQNPHRQGQSQLGYRDSSAKDGYKTCCLGEGGLIAGVCYWGKDLSLKTTSGDNLLLGGGAYKQLGLYSERGDPKDNSYKSLSTMNDTGYTWPRIAETIRQNPKMYFKRKV